MRSLIFRRSQRCYGSRTAKQSSGVRRRTSSVVSLGASPRLASSRAAETNNQSTSWMVLGTGSALAATTAGVWFQWQGNDSGIDSVIDRPRQIVLDILLRNRSILGCTATTKEACRDSENENNTSARPAVAQFPSLQAHLILEDEATRTETWIPFQLNSLTPEGEIRSRYFCGKVRLMLQPLDDAHDPNFDNAVHPPFTFQLQGRFLAPKGNDTAACAIEEDEKDSVAPPLRQDFYMGAQTVTPSFVDQLGHLGVQVCRLLLTLLAQSIQGDMRYSFGNAGTGELPYIAFPLAMAMNEIRVDKPTGGHGDEMEPHLATSSKTTPFGAENDNTHWQSDCQYTMSFTAHNIDLAAWKIRRPFEFPLQRLWGNGTPLQLIIYHQNPVDGRRTYLMKLQLTPT